MKGRNRFAGTPIALLAALVILVGAGQAVASGFSLSSTSFQTVFRPLTLTGVEGGSTFVIRCNVTLEGSFEARTFAIDRGPSEVGVVTRASMADCNAEGARIVFLTETLPWTVVFASYTGSLPRISTIRYELRGLRVLVEPTPFMACLYRSSQSTPAVYVWSLNEAGEVTTASMAEERTAALLSRLFEETFLICPGALRFSGTETSFVRFSLI